MNLRAVPSAIVPCLSLVLLFHGGTRTEAQTNQAGQVFPQVSFSRTTKGTEIITALGSRLASVAAWYGKTDAGLRSICQRDKTIRMDRQGHLHYVCEGLLPANAGTTTGTTGTAASSYPASETFLLHSKPGATKVIFLDFDGNTTSGTSWNTNFTAGASITTPPYDTDGTPGSFNSTELANIQLIWQSVAEDYAPFDVDVTTQDPGLEALRKTTTSDASFGIRLCIGGSSYDWYGVGAGGVAYLNSITWNSDTPAFIFPAQLGNGNPKYTAEAASHEAGHTFGLNHDGQTNGTEYYAGHANWAPIMGVGYYKDVVQWSKGEYSLANNTQDDLVLISGICPYRADAHGDDIVHATALTGTTPTASGIIEKRTDADLFGFTTGAGAISFTATPSTPSPNLDVQLALYNGAGNLVTSAAPATMGATLSTTVAQGTYYLAVDGVGTGDAAAAYNDYSSIGQYNLSGSVAPVSGQPPVAVADNSAPLTGFAPLTVNFSSAGSYDPDGTIAACDWDFGDGTTSTAASPAHAYSTPGTYTASLVVVDNSGLSSPADTVTVVVQSSTVVFVANIAMSLTQSTKGYQATASVTIKDPAGKLKSGATVTGQWSGLTTGTSSKTTGKTGVAAFPSTLTKTKGTFTFTVTGVTLSGYTYAPTMNVETRDSIATP